MLCRFSNDSLYKNNFAGINYEVLGYVKCSWYESKPVGNTHRVDHYEGQENYMNQSFCLVGEFEDDQVEITAGEHKFDISYALPSNLPTSFKSKNGSIKYKILVIVDRSKKANSKFEFPFTVIRPLNLNDAGSFLRNPLKVELFKNFKMDFSAEPLYLSASIPFYGYVPGQVIHVDVEVNNQSKTHVKEVTASLKKLITMNSDGLVKKSKLIIESEAKVSADRVPVSSRRNFEIKLEVPSLAPEILNCGVIQVHYELQIKAKTSGLSRSPRLNLPITIGTVPLQNRNAIPPSPTYSSLRKVYPN